MNLVPSIAMEEQEEAELEEMELEYREEVEGSEDLSAQVDQFFTEMELDVSKRRRTLKAIMKVYCHGDWTCIKCLFI